MMDANGYPTKAELARIKRWNVLADIQGLVEYVRELWKYADEGGCSYCRGSGALELHTVGWSGNEDIVGALQGNALFWALCWQKSERGGHYCFTVPLR